MASAAVTRPGASRQFKPDPINIHKAAHPGQACLQVRAWHLWRRSRIVCKEERHMMIKLPARQQNFTGAEIVTLPFLLADPFVSLVLRSQDF